MVERASRLEDEMKVQALLLQQLNGCMSLMILGEQSWHGRQVFCRFRNESWHRDQRLAGRFAHMTDAVFEDEVIGEIGLVHDGLKGVPLEVLQAVQVEVLDRVLDKSTMVTSFGTGFKDPSLGWVRQTLLTFPKIPVGDVEEVPWNPLLEEMFGIPPKCVSLAAREQAMS